MPAVCRWGMKAAKDCARTMHFSFSVAQTYQNTLQTTPAQVVDFIGCGLLNSQETNREQREKTRVFTPKTPEMTQFQEQNTQEAVAVSV